MVKCTTCRKEIEGMTSVPRGTQHVLCVNCAQRYTSKNPLGQMVHTIDVGDLTREQANAVLKDIMKKFDRQHE